MAKSKMTKKQVAAFVDNDDNWDITPGNDYVRIGTLDFGELHYAVIFLREVNNHYEIYRYNAEPEYSWRRQYYYEYDPQSRGFVYNISNTLIKEKIYQEANK